MLLAAAFTVAVAWAFGKLLLDRTALKLARVEAHLLAFVAGAIPLAAATAVCRAGGRPALAAMGIVVLALAASRRGPARGPLPPLPRAWRIPFLMVVAAFGLLYLLRAMMPEITPDGRLHHLGHIAAAWQGGALPVSPVQLVYLFAFAFGGPAAPALIHLAFLATLATLLVSFGRRIEMPKAGMLAAALVFASPLAGAHGTTASEDIAVAAMLFAAFSLIPARFPALLSVAGAALSMTAWQGGSPFSGIPGPAFLLAPLGLVALRSRPGRLALAAGSALIWFGWMPALPFFALALGLALERTRYTAPLLLAAHAILSWPDVAALYTPADWRIGHVSLRAALRLRPQAEYLKDHLPRYEAARLVERAPHGAAIYSLTPLPRAYMRRDTITTPELNQVLHTPVIAELQPLTRLRLRFAPADAASLCLRGPGSIHELRLFDEERELPRAGWRLRADPNSPTVQNALDNSLVTEWNGAAIEIDFGRPQRVSQVLLECRRPARWQVELNRKPVSATVEESTAPPPPMRRMAIYELKARGIGYLLVPDDDPAAPDLLAYARDWGLHHVACGGGAHLLRLE